MLQRLGRFLGKCSLIQLYLSILLDWQTYRHTDRRTADRQSLQLSLLTTRCTSSPSPAVEQLSLCGNSSFLPHSDQSDWELPSWPQMSKVAAAVWRSICQSGAPGAPACPVYGTSHLKLNWIELIWHDLRRSWVSETICQIFLSQVCWTHCSLTLWPLSQPSPFDGLSVILAPGHSDLILSHVIAFLYFYFKFLSWSFKICILKLTGYLVFVLSKRGIVPGEVQLWPNSESKWRDESYLRGHNVRGRCVKRTIVFEKYLENDFNDSGFQAPIVVMVVTEPCKAPVIKVNK